MSVLICGVDLFTGFSRAAAVTARMSEQLDCEVVLVHVDREQRMFTSIARARQQRDLRELVRAYDLPANTSVCIREGEPADELTRAARDFDAELIVVGSRGRLELEGALLGSVSRALMTRAPCPVVVVPPDALLPKRPRRDSIVCGVEGGPRDRRLLRFADDLRRRLDSALHAVHAFAPRPGLSQAAHARLRNALGEAGVVADTTVIALPPALALERVAEEDSAALVVVGCHDGRPTSVLGRSVSVRLAAAGKRPVAVLPPSAELAPGSGHYELRRDAA